MSIGTLQARIVLDEARKIYCGSSEPVTGNVVLTFTPSPKSNNTELFGPLKINLLFHGRSKSKIWKKNGNSTTIYRGRAPLFQRSETLYSDSFKAQPGESHSFPFEIYFPRLPSHMLMEIGNPTDGSSSKPVVLSRQALAASTMASITAMCHLWSTA